MDIPPLLAQPEEGTTMDDADNNKRKKKNVFITCS